MYRFLHNADSFVAEVVERTEDSAFPDANISFQEIAGVRSSVDCLDVEALVGGEGGLFCYGRGEVVQELVSEGNEGCGGAW